MEEASNVPSLEPGTYEHYKGGRYEVLGVGCHSETLEYFVVYVPLDKHSGKPGMWIRPYDMFLEDVTINGEAVPRFKKLKE